MRLLKSPALPVTLATLAVTTALSSAEGDAPGKEFRFDGALVRTGVKPVLTWSVPDPSTGVEDLVTIGDDDSLVTSRDVVMKVRLLGASYQPYGTDAVVDFQLKVGKASWETAFHGTNGAIDPLQTIYSTKVNSGTEVNFAAAGNLYGRIWTPSRNTLTENLNVIVLKDGDPVPTCTPAFSQGDIEAHVSKYIQDGKVALGPRDVIYLMEIGQADASAGGFDMQDLVVVVTFDETNKASATEIASIAGDSAHFPSKTSPGSK